MFCLTADRTIDVCFCHFLFNFKPNPVSFNVSLFPSFLSNFISVECEDGWINFLRWAEQKLGSIFLEWQIKIENLITTRSDEQVLNHPPTRHMRVKTVLNHTMARSSSSQLKARGSCRKVWVLSWGMMQFFDKQKIGSIFYFFPCLLWKSTCNQLVAVGYCDVPRRQASIV